MTPSERMRLWKEANPERYAENQRRYREANKEKTKTYNAAYRTKHLEKEKARKISRRDIDNANRRKRYAADAELAKKIGARSKEWRKANPERYAEQLRIWKENNPDRHREIQRAGAANRRARKTEAGKISAEDAKAVRRARKCAACGQKHPRMEIDHILALSRGGKNHRSNLQLLCRPCNRSKHAKDQITWAQENGRLL